jgi:hypothetical protein
MRITEQLYKNRHALYILICIAIFALGAYFRFSNISSRNLEYDEIWTITHYSNSSNINIFKDLSTPNNHPLNSLLIKYSMFFFGQNNFAVRLPALIAGLFLMLLIPLLSYKVFKSKLVAIFAMLLASFNGVLVHYSHTARGYEIQTTLIFLFILSLVCIEQKNRSSLILDLMLLIVLPILCVLTIPTSILFLAPLVLSHMLYRYIRNKRSTNKRLIACKNAMINRKNLFYSFMFLCLLGWFIINYSQFKQGQQFGTNIESIKQFYYFVYSIITKLNLIPLFILIIIGSFVKNSKILYLSLSAFGLFVFIMFSAIFIKAGPPRVYIPIIPIFIFVGSDVLYYLLSSIFSKKTFTACLFLLLGMSWILYSFWFDLQAWTPPQYRKDYNLLCKKLPMNIFIVFPAGHGYPASFNNKFGAVQNHLRTPRNDNSYIAIYQSSNIIDGINKKGQVSRIKVPESIRHSNYFIDKSSLDLYKLRKLQKDISLKNKVIIASLSGKDSQSINTLAYSLMNNLSGDWIILNSWFRVPLYVNNNIRLSSAVLACYNSKITIEKLISIQNSYNDALKFYYIDSIILKSNKMLEANKSIEAKL